jgi:hypothetical protein
MRTPVLETFPTIVRAPIELRAEVAEKFDCDVYSKARAKM